MRLKERDDAAKRKTEEADAPIRAREEAKTEKRDRGRRPRLGRRRSISLQRGKMHGLRPRRRRRRRSPSSLPKRLKRRRLRQRQESHRKPIPQRDQNNRPPVRSDPRQIPKEQRERGQRLRQGPSLRLISRKRKMIEQDQVCIKQIEEGNGWSRGRYQGESGKVKGGGRGK